MHGLASLFVVIVAYRLRAMNSKYAMLNALSIAIVNNVMPLYANASMTLYHAMPLLCLYMNIMYTALLNNWPIQ